MRTTRNFLTLVSLLSLATWSAVAAEVHPLHLKPGDRVVFFGDSITEQRMYTNYVETYLVLRYPGMNLSFVNAGWGGDTTEGGAGRLERDVLGAHPTVVAICYGMNDGGYGWTGSKGAAAAYGKNLREIVRRLEAKKVRVVLMTPGVVDDRVPGLKWLKDQTDYNRKELRALADETIAVAQERNLPVVDVHALMTMTLSASGRAGVDMGSDGIHPDEGGSLIMAYGLLKALGVPPRNQAIRRDLTKSGTSFEITVDPLPYAVEEKARRMLPFLPFSAEFNRVSLVINGLTALSAVLEFDGRLTPVLDRAALEAGLPLEDMWGIGAMEEAERAAMITREKANMYRQFWRALALPDNWWMEAPFDPEPQRIALGAAGELEKWRRQAVIPRPMRVTVRAVDDRPVQLNAGGTITRWRASAGFAPVPSRTFTGAELTRLTDPGVALPGWPRVALDGVPADRLACAYARSLPSPFSVLAVVESDGPQKATVILEGEGPVTAYLNGRQVKDIKGDKDPRTIELDLKQGENRLALAFPYRKGGIRGFVARVSALSGSVRNRW
jgi:lysophospholipase L1-like esterase